MEQQRTPGWTYATGTVAAPEDPRQAITAIRRFDDRRDAGRQLAALLGRFRGERPVIVGMPRGGVPVAAEVAKALGAPLDVAVVRKIGAPQNPEFAIGAVAEGGVRLLSGEAAGPLGLTPAEVRLLYERAEQELSDYVRRYRGSGEPARLDGRTVILVDDGLATGRSAAVALRSLRRRGAKRLILAVPVAASASARALGELADEVLSMELPEDLGAVGYWYDRFAPTSDVEVREALAHGRGSAEAGGVL